jgi:hypothetical protein
MSGQRLTNPTDASKFRQAYLANLKLQADIDDMNLQANKVYKKTGQTPTQLTDNRTTSETLADVERLKIDVRSGLAQIADGKEANSISQQLSPAQLTFVAQHINDLVKELKPKYKYGILADVFIPYLVSYMDKENKTLEVKSGLQQTSGRNVVMGIEQILNDMIDPALLRDMVDNLDVLPAGLMGRRIESLLRRDIQLLEDNLPNRADLQGIDMIPDAILRSQVQQELSEALQELPTTAQTLVILRSLGVAVKAGDPDAVDRIAIDLHNLLSLQQSTIDQIQNIQGQVLNPSSASLSSSTPTPAIAQPVSSSASASVLPALPADGDKPRLRAEYRELTSPALTTRDQLDNYFKTMYRYVKAPNETKSQFSIQFSGKSQPQSLQDLKSVVKEVNRRLRLFAWGEPNPVGIGEGIGRIKGCGVGRNAVVKRTDFSKGIMPVNKFVPFGRYFVDSHKLNNNIISLKRGTGCNVAGFPVERLSKEMGNVLRTIVGGGQPQFHHLEQLSPDEKMYLHKIAKHSNILDRLSIPTPNKDDDEKDINQFEVMKGELLNGNDSNDLIKKFKFLIMKMVKKDLLPKSQAKDLLMDLASLGY